MGSKDNEFQGRLIVFPSVGKFEKFLRLKSTKIEI